MLGAARIAGIMAAKRTSELIPLCHPLALFEGDRWTSRRQETARLHRPRHGQGHRTPRASRWRR